MAQRSETFGRLLKGAINSIATYEGKTAPRIEEELGAQIHLAGKTLQRYKSGYVPADEHAIRVLAEAAVRRGFLGREWLQRFLHAARYPFADTLLDQLCPAPQIRPRPPRVYENLPAPTYSQFVMRAEPFGDIRDGLGKRSAAVIIVGLGGNGKTSLAREVAAWCLHSDRDGPLFDAVVWVSDKDRPGTTNVSIVLDEIARTLDYPGFTQFDHEEKRREIEQLLRRQRVLLVVDNFETITDGALLAWLLNLPEPSKALITTREYRREFRRGGWPVELRGMTEAEAWELVRERAQALKIAQLFGNQTRLEPLLVTTGGNPKALTMTLGLLKYERRPLQQVVDDLYAARGELFEDLFTRAWSLLDEAARRVLLVMTFFPDSASSEAMMATADVTGFAFDRAVERLTDLALLDVQQVDLMCAPRYVLHPLVRAFAGAKLAHEPDFATRSRERWMQYWLAFARQHKTAAWNDTRQQNLDRLEHELASLHAVVQYCADTYRWEYVIELVFLLNRVWSFRGYYEDRTRFVALALHAAEQHGRPEDQIKLLCIQIRTLCYLNDPQQAMRCVERARTLLRTVPDPANDLEQNINYSQIRAALLLEDYAPINDLARRNVALSHSPYLETMYSYDIAEYAYRVGRYDDATTTLQTLLTASQATHDRRGMLRGTLLLARIAMARQQCDPATAYLHTAERYAADMHHRRLSAEVIQVLAQRHILCGDVFAARAALTEAIDLFERLGMRRDLAEARQALADLEQTM